MRASLARERDAPQHDELRKRMQRMRAQRAGTAGSDAASEAGEASFIPDHEQSLAAARELAKKVTPRAFT